MHMGGMISLPKCWNGFTPISKYIIAYQLLFRKRFFPDSWKISLVRPILKAPNPKLLSDLHSTSFISAVSKILENKQELLPPKFVFRLDTVPLQF
jgi:hypothetical protein